MRLLDSRQDAIRMLSGLQLATVQAQPAVPWSRGVLLSWATPTFLLEPRF